MPDSTAKRWRLLKWAAVTCAVILASALIGTLLAGRRQYHYPGNESRLCASLGAWTSAHGFKGISMRLFSLSESFQEKQMDAELRSGRLALVTFHNGGRLGMSEFSQQALDYGRSNGWQVVMVRNPKSDFFEVLLESKGKVQMEAFVRELEKTKAHSPFE